MHRVGDGAPSCGRPQQHAVAWAVSADLRLDGMLRVSSAAHQWAGSWCCPPQPSLVSALHAEIGNTSPRLQFDTKSGTLTVERTAGGYAMQLPLLAPTDGLPDVAGLPEVRV